MSHLVISILSNQWKLLFVKGCSSDLQGISVGGFELVRATGSLVPSLNQMDRGTCQCNAFSIGEGVGFGDGVGEILVLFPPIIQ